MKLVRDVDVTSDKIIRSAADLAINGAPPMFAEPIHVGRPNIGDHKRFLQRASNILDSGWLSNNGPIAQEFEQRIASFLGVKHCVAMCNGTIALEIATRALELKGEVIVPSYTFIATAHALQWQEITPIFADIDPATHNLDPAAVWRMITPRTTGIIGVHLWGRASPVKELEAIAREHNLRLMFDASHGFGCSLNGELLGGFGECEVFSFHATKVFNTFEGGAVVTNNDTLAEKMRLMRNFGFSGYDNVIYPGTNGKMSEIAAAMGLTNLEDLDDFVAINRRNYQCYRDAIASIPGLSMLEYDESERNNYQYVVVEVAPYFPIARDRIVEILHAENVLARKYFWPGCHNMEPYRSYYPHAELVLPNTKRVSDRVVVLPTGSALQGDAIRGIVSILGVLASGKV
ncbi:MAG: aminotransferase class I/II-fold pyridoxal phosphate-dependent enzyme [Betaproteobacteria bacterium]|nr:MAG: aminotransferase class I/II-fold pyridoxal phosphate-dependent enzyme [Betaproteobacteria bacterium]